MKIIMMSPVALMTGFFMIFACVHNSQADNPTIPDADALPESVIETNTPTIDPENLPYATLYQAVAANELYTTIGMIEAGVKDTKRNVEGKNALLLAAENDMPHVITLLVDEGDDINVQDNLGNSALHLAVAANDLYTCQMLLEKGINKEILNEKNYTALHIAAESAGETLIEMLVEMGMNPLFTKSSGRFYSAYDAAADSKRWEITALFRRHGYDRGALVNAGYGDVDAFKEYVATDPDKLDETSKMGYAPIHFATAMGHYDMVKFLLQHGSDPLWTNAEGLQPFVTAIEKGYKDIFLLFLENGLDINERDGTYFGNTPLIHAVRDGNLDMINFLLDLGAYIGQPSALGDTPLHNAVDSNQIESAKLLLERGAVVGLKNHDAITPLHIAAEKNLSDMATLLLSYGANIDNKDKRQWTALHIAVDKGHIPMIRFLLENHASPLPSGQTRRYAFTSCCKKQFLSYWRHPH